MTPALPPAGYWMSTEVVPMSTDVGKSIKRIEEKYFAKPLPDFNVGDTVKMRIKVREADKMRIHPFEGTVIKKTGKGLKGSFTVRKISFGEGVERVFPLYSPVIENLEVVSRGVAKKAKLYYLRNRVGKATRIQKAQILPEAAPVHA